MRKLFILLLFIIPGLLLTAIFALPAAIKETQTGIDVYNQKGLFNYLAKPFLFYHTKFCHLFGVEPDKTNKITTKQMNHNLNFKDSIKTSSVIEVIKQIPQQHQVQYDLQRQLHELRIAANKLGLYDAADFIRPDSDKYNL